ncbi:flagellin N-terminal helical domain-containing protein [Rhizobium rosettiformans]|uniref:flagellin N-terminal helical domain-containing protein n=1 Tax=Rhizobium rosettiformans TaxID=1368430 RepID=UPI0028612485|nr:flagellin [Rhizobium rosettiformans]MDR7028582.1 flagellin [Rhizobium rosettiformans]MDR7064136.1 flagellin [Rhizobium rosettiformans]
MTSILTNIAAMSALQTLRSIGSNMEDTQARVSSGQRVGEASDNAAYWSIATTMRSDNMALSAVADALGLGASKIDTAYAGMESAIDVVKEIKAKLVTATEEGVDKKKVQEEIDQLQDQLLSIAQSASFSGENWLVGESTQGAATPGANPDMNVVSGFVRDNTGVSVKVTNYALDNTATGNTLFGSIDAATGVPDATGILGTVGTATVTESVYTLDITTFTDPLTVATQMADALTLVENALTAMTSAAAELGSISMRIDLQEDFVSDLSDSLESGIGRLVDADMNEESTRLKALQTQQQLAVQSLSIANSSSEVILSLFR